MSYIFARDKSNLQNNQYYRVHGVITKVCENRTTIEDQTGCIEVLMILQNTYIKPGLFIDCFCVYDSSAEVLISINYKEYTDLNSESKILLEFLSYYQNQKKNQYINTNLNFNLNYNNHIFHSFVNDIDSNINSNTVKKHENVEKQPEIEKDDDEDDEFKLNDEDLKLLSYINIP